MQHSQAGSSLIEMLVATTIFAFAFIATASLLVNSTRLVALNELASEAVVIAQEQLEDLRARPFANMEEVCGSASVPSSKGGVSFTVDCTIVEDAAAGVNEVTVTVSWSDHGEGYEYEVQGIFAQVAPNL